LNFFFGSSSSKFVAEKLVYKANKLGLKTVIVRPGMISSSSLTGYCNEGKQANKPHPDLTSNSFSDDFDNRLLRGIIMSKKSPFFTDAELEMTPVDFTAKIIVNAGSKYQRMNGKIFNIYSPHRLNFDEWITTIEELTDETFEKYPFHEWKEKVLPNLGMLRGYFAEPVLTSLTRR
jgi:nucleoside-diphosphate-sugar epimerase